MSYQAGTVVGLSTLRASEQAARPPAEKSEAAKQREAYLQKYTSGGGDDGRKRKKKRRKKEHEAKHSSGIKLLDEDVDWTQRRTHDNPSNIHYDDEGPLIANQDEVHYELKMLRAAQAAQVAWTEDNGDDNDEDIWQRPQQHATASGRTTGVSVPDAEPGRSGHRESGRVRHDSDDDASPPRRDQAPAHGARHDSDDEPNPPRRGQMPTRRAQDDSDGDASPPRRDRVPARRARHDSDDDASPPRRCQAGPSRARHDSDGDASPPRRGAAPARCARHDSDDDASPPRRSDATPHGARHDSDDDASPARREPVPARRARHDSDDDPSPPRRGGPPARQARHDSDDDANPPRREPAPSKRHVSDDDASPPRRDRPSSAAAGRTSHREDPDDRGSRQTRYRDRDGAKAAPPVGGIVSAEKMGAELAAKREADRKRLLEMDPSVSGRGANATYRIDGKQVTAEEYKQTKEAQAKAKRRQPRYIEEAVPWSGGLAQQQAQSAAAEAEQREAAKAFHRGFDEDADMSMRTELRQEDPMAAHFAKKLPSALDTAAKRRVQDTYGVDGSVQWTVPQEVPDHSWLRRGAQPMPNRYNIKPGRHWDGVHRSNGFEQKFVFTHQNRKAQRALDEYVYAEDM